jgi:hypothetical protein
MFYNVNVLNLTGCIFSNKKGGYEKDNRDISYRHLVVSAAAGPARAIGLHQASEFQVTSDTNGHSTPMSA